MTTEQHSYHDRFQSIIDGPPGPRPISDVIAKAVPLIASLRADRVRWRTIAALLNAVLRETGADGVGVDALRGMYHRALRKEHSSTAPDKFQISTTGPRKVFEPTADVNMQSHLGLPSHLTEPPVTNNTAGGISAADNPLTRSRRKAAQIQQLKEIKHD